MYSIFLGTCSVLGYTNVQTFDGKQYELYPKACGYSLLRHCHHNGSTPEFDVRIQNNNCFKSENSRYCQGQDIYITLKGKVIEIKRSSLNGKPELLVDGGVLDDHTLVEYVGGTSVVVSTDELQIVISGRNIYLTVGPDLKDQTCGLCGMFNMNSQDDFHTYNGGVAATANSFLKSWLNPELERQPDCDVGDVGSIGLGETEPTHSIDYCGMNLQAEVSVEERAIVLKDPVGPFKDCLEEVSSSSFYDRAKKTGCRDSFSLCDVVAGYAKACADKGIVVKDWRERITDCAERKYLYIT